MNRQILHNTLSIQSHSRHAEAMHRYITRFVHVHAKQIGQSITIDEHEGNIYVTKGVSSIYPCVVAHTDTVHAIIPNFVVNVQNGVYVGKNRDTGFPHGVGGDDKVGIAIALSMLTRFDAIKLAFFRDEELGCRGSQEARLSFFDDCAFVLQADRKGNADVVRSVLGVALYSEAFSDATREMRERHGFTEVEGMLTDVYMLRRLGMPICAFNISCGYWNPHSDNETVVYDDVVKTTNFMADVIDTLAYRQWPCYNQPYSLYSLFEEEDEEGFDDDDMEIDEDEITVYDAQRYVDECPHCHEFNISYDDAVGMNWCWTCQDYFWADREARV